LRGRFRAALDDDFNTAGGLSVLFDAAREANERVEAGAPAADLAAAVALFGRLGGDVLGLDFSGPAGGSGNGLEKDLLDTVLDLRNRLRAAKQFALADGIRDSLARLGVSIEDGKDGSRWVRQ
jgi:cysteinyl-tRNA synthetase